MTEEHAHKWLILVAVGSALLMGTVDGSIVNVALPSLTTDLHTRFYLVQWAVLSFLMGLAVCLLTAGRLGDMLGKKRVFTAGLVIFVLSSALCGLSPGIYWLIAFRFVQAVGAAMIVALGVAIVMETWPRTEHGTAIGISAGIISLGAAGGACPGRLHSARTQLALDLFRQRAHRYSVAGARSHFCAGSSTQESK